MPKKEDGFQISETGNWNVAGDYSKLKVMKQLYVADDYASIARYGSPTIQDEMQTSFPKDLLQIKGFDRLVHCLITIIDNSYFAIKHKKHKRKLKEYKSELKRIRDVIPTLTESVNRIRGHTSQVRIKQPDFFDILDRVLEIKSEINIYLNKSDLLFTNKEEFDPQKYKKAIYERATTKG